MSNPLLELTRARVLEFVREPGALFWVFVFPILLAIGLGIAFRTKPPERVHVALQVASAEHLSAVEARLYEALEHAPDLQASKLDASEAQRQLAKSKVDLVVVPTSTGAATAVEYRYDPTQPQSRSARFIADAALESALGRRDVLTKRDQVLSEPGERYIDYLVPGLIGMNLMGSSMWGIGYAVVQTRARKLMKRFAATPMRRTHYLLSFMFSRFIFLFLEVIALVAFGYFAFGVAVRGSLLAVAAIATVGALCFAGIALLVAARPLSVEAASGWMNFVMLPMWFTSGVFFSYERFPEVVLPLLRVLPLTAINDALRAVMNDGRPLAEVSMQLLVLAIWGLLSFAVALRVFRWQ